jgi:hypothetical protein
VPFQHTDENEIGDDGEGEIVAVFQVIPSELYTIVLPTATHINPFHAIPLTVDIFLLAADVTPFGDMLNFTPSLLYIKLFVVVVPPPITVMFSVSGLVFTEFESGKPDILVLV